MYFQNAGPRAAAAAKYQATSSSIFDRATVHSIARADASFEGTAAWGYCWGWSALLIAQLKSARRASRILRPAATTCRQHGAHRTSRGAAEPKCIPLAHAVTRNTRGAQHNTSVVDSNDWRRRAACCGLLRQLSEPRAQQHTAHTPSHLQQARRCSSPVAHVVRACGCPTRQNC